MSGADTINEYKDTFSKLYKLMDYYIKKIEAGQVNQTFWDNLAVNLGEVKPGFEYEMFEVIAAELMRRAGTSNKKSIQ